MLKYWHIDGITGRIQYPNSVVINQNKQITQTIYQKQGKRFIKQQGKLIEVYFDPFSKICYIY